MSGPPFARDDAILAMLRDKGPMGSVELAAGLGSYERRTRRGLRNLIKGGYVFSPEHGLYRITAAGAAAIAPIVEQIGPTEQLEVTDPLPTPAKDRPRSKLHARLGRRR